jgi:hypothetical protein
MPNYDRFVISVYDKIVILFDRRNGREGYTLLGRIRVTVVPLPGRLSIETEPP